MPGVCRNRAVLRPLRVGARLRCSVRNAQGFEPSTERDHDGVSDAERKAVAACPEASAFVRSRGQALEEQLTKLRRQHEEARWPGGDPRREAYRGISPRQS